jgi:hypothetical protein
MKAGERHGAPSLTCSRAKGAIGILRCEPRRWEGIAGKIMHDNVVKDGCGRRVSLRAVDLSEIVRIFCIARRISYAHQLAKLKMGGIQLQRC